MKKCLFSILLVHSLLPFFMNGGIEHGQLVTGSLQFPSCVAKVPVLKILYQGYKYTIEACDETQRTTRKGHFELYINNKCQELFVIIAENLQIPDKNNFDHFKTSSAFSYRLFKLTKRELPREKDEPLKLTWSIEELSHNNQEVILEDNTLILLMPPTMIAKLEEEPWLADQHVARLPRIVFNESISEQELQDAATRMTLTLLDFEIFHAQVPKRFMITDSRIVAMPYLQRAMHT